MATGTFYVAVDDDDGYWANGDQWSYFDHHESYFNLGAYGGALTSFCFARFANVTIPKGSTIVSAKLTLCCDYGTSAEIVNTFCYFNNADNAVAPTSVGAGNALALTDAIEWDALPAWTTGVDYDSPSLATLLQGIVNRAGWASGNAAMVVFQDNGSTGGTGCYRAVRTRRYTATLCPRLVVEWTPPPEGTFKPAASADDGVWDDGADIFDYTMANLVLGSFSAGYNHKIWIRFPNVTIPQGSAIVSAKIVFQAYTGDAATACNVNCYFNNIDNAISPTNRTTANALALTAAVAWNNIASWSTGTDYDSPALASILQTVIDRAGWFSGNAVVAVIKNNTSSDGGHRMAKSYNESPTLCARLVVQYIPPPPPPEETVTESAMIAGSMLEYLPTAVLAEQADIADLFESGDFIFEDIPESIIAGAVVRGGKAYELTVEDEFFIGSDYSQLDWIKTIEDSFFAYCDAIPAWHLTLLESLISTDAIFTILGLLAGEYILLEGEPVSSVKVQHILNDMVFAFDDSYAERYYLLLAEDTIDFGDVLQEILGNLICEVMSFAGVPVAGLRGYRSIEDTINAEDASVSERYYLLLADETVDMTDGEVTFLSLDLTVAETFNARDVAVPMGSFVALASESLVFRDIDSYIHGLIIEEGLALGDVELTRWVFDVLIETGFGIAEAFD